MFYSFREPDLSITKPLLFFVQCIIQVAVVYKANIAAKTPKTPATDMPKRTFSALAADEDVDAAPPDVVADPAPAEVADPPVWTAPEETAEPPEEDPVGATVPLPLLLADPPAEAPPVVEAPATLVTPGRASVVAVTVAAEDLHAFWQFSKAKFSAAVPFP